MEAYVRGRAALLAFAAQGVTGGAAAGAGAAPSSRRPLSDFQTV